jgi:two-component system LytT family sensor kinase
LGTAGEQQAIDWQRFEILNGHNACSCRMLAGRDKRFAKQERRLDRNLFPWRLRSCHNGGAAVDLTHTGDSRQPRRIGYPGVPTLLLAWTVVGGVAYTRHFLQDSHVALGRGIWRELLIWLSCFYPWVVLAPFVFRLERRFPLGPTQWARHLAVLALAALPFTWLAQELAAALSTSMQHLFGGPLSISAAWWVPPPGELLLQQFLYWSTVCAGCVIRHLMQSQENELKAAQLAMEKSQLEANLRQAQLEALRMRLNPHFLFNTLQNISVLIQQQPKTASQMLTRLGDLLRMAVHGNTQPETTLDAELALTRAYVEIEKMRFDDRLSAIYDIAPGTAQALVPTLLLQPIVENAILHGFRNSTESGVIIIRVAEENERLVLSVTDNGAGFRAEAVTDLDIGVGLGATCERLARMYGEQHEFAISKVPEGGTQVCIALPRRTDAKTVEVTHASSSVVNR